MKRRLILLVCGLVVGLPGGLWGQAAGHHHRGMGRSMALLIDHSLETGWPLSTIQTLSMERIALEMAVGLWRGESWYLEYSMSVFPLALVRNNPLTPSIPVEGGWVVAYGSPRATSLGSGLHPLGARGGWGLGRMTAYGGLSAGMIVFDKATPGSNASHANFSGDLEVGVRVAIADGVDLMAGYQFNHVSNAAFGEENPGLDSHMIRIGLRKW